MVSCILKRHFLVGLVACALIFSSVAFAQAGKNVLFRGVDWCLCGDAALDAVGESITSEAEVSWNKTEANTRRAYYLNDGGVVYQGAYNVCGAFYTPENLVVADFPVSLVYLEFIPSVVDGFVCDGFSDSVLVSAEYLFKKEDVSYIRGAFYSIREKLIYLYGAPDMECDFADPGYGGDLCVWFDGSGGSVRLSSAATSLDDMDSFFVWYGLSDIGNRIADLNRFPVKRSVGSVDGL